MNVIGARITRRGSAGVEISTSAPIFTHGRSRSYTSKTNHIFEKSPTSKSMSPSFTY